MRKRIALWEMVVAGVVASTVVVACHADENDPAGQAEELADPVRRQNAIVNLTRIYTKALADQGGDRDHQAVKAIADIIHDDLTQVYINNDADVQNGQSILDLLAEMQDPRTIPALVKALNWRAEVSEQHAIRSAQTLTAMNVPDDKKGEVIEALSGALQRVTGARGEDNRMRIAFIRALGKMNDSRAAPALIEVATTQSEEQQFIINRMAAQELGRISDLGDATDSAVTAMIKALYLFQPNAPQMRMNDVAAEVLVRIGRPALQPLLQLLAGQNAEASAIVDQYIAAVRQQNEDAANAMNKDMLLGSEATFTLGELGFRDAFDPLMAQTQGHDDASRKFNAAIALVRLNLEAADAARVRDMLKRVYTEMPSGRDGWIMQMRLVAAMRQLYDPAVLPFFLEQARDHEVPDIRIEAVLDYALLANREEAGALRTYINGLPESEGIRDTFAQNNPLLEAANECNDNLECWIGKLDASENTMVRKAAFMIGRYGRGNEAAITALVDKLGHDEIEVRMTALQALDRIAVSGSQAAIDKIEHLRETEEGRGVWTAFKRQALPAQARLRARMQPAS